MSSCSFQDNFRRKESTCHNRIKPLSVVFYLLRSRVVYGEPEFGVTPKGGKFGIGIQSVEDFEELVTSIEEKLSESTWWQWNSFTCDGIRIHIFFSPWRIIHVRAGDLTRAICVALLKAVFICTVQDETFQLQFNQCSRHWSRHRHSTSQNEPQCSVVILCFISRH